MKKSYLLILGLLMVTGFSIAQNPGLNRLGFLVGKWSGTGSGFGNNRSTIESEFRFVVGGQYLEVINESKFDPTENKPEGETHIDRGFISYDKNREAIVYRQFNIEGFVNRYILVDSLSTDSIFVFETEAIENFVPGGKVRWTIKRLSGDRLETIFDVAFPGGNYSCFGRNTMSKRH